MQRKRGWRSVRRRFLVLAQVRKNRAAWPGKRRAWICKCCVSGDRFAGVHLSAAARGIKHVSRGAAGLAATGLWLKRARARLESAGARGELAAGGCVVGYGNATSADARANRSPMSLGDNTGSKAAPFTGQQLRV